MLNSTRTWLLCLQAANSSLTKPTSAEGLKLSATGLVTQGSTESVPPAIKAELCPKAEDASNAVISALPQNASVGAKEEPAGALPMEVDDDAMFQKKPSKPVKTETSEVGHSTLYWPTSLYVYWLKPKGF